MAQFAHRFARLIGVRRSVGPVGSPTPTPTPIPPPPPAPTFTMPSYASIVTFGDSITVGVNASNNATKSWAALLAGAIGAALLNKGVSGTVLQNSADSGGGARASNGRDRFQADVLGANRKAAVFIAYGFNDARYTAALATFNVAQYQNDYREVLNGLILGGYARGDIYVGSPYSISDSGLATGSTGFAGQSRAGFEAYVAAAASVAAEFGTNYCDLYAATNTAAFKAETDSNDHIHPLDAGHAAIALAWRTQTRAANTGAAPASVMANVSGSTVTVTAAAVAGATAYEYALVANPLDYATSTNGSFTAVANGSYYARARAVFADGSRGPWAFSAAAVGVVVTTLHALSLSPTIATSGTVWSATISGATSGSIVAATASDGTTLTVSGSTVSGTFAAAGSPTVTLSEALANAGNTPRTSTTTVSVGAAAGPAAFLQDGFSDAAGTDLAAHAPTTGGSWVAASSVTGNTSPKISASGRLYNQGTASVYRATTPSPAADYYVEAVIDFVANVSGETIGVAARMSASDQTLYFARWSQTAAGWQLFKTVAGTATQLGATSADAFASGSRTLRLTVSGTTIGLSVGGTTLVSVTDTSIAAAGYAGIRSTGTQTSTTGRQMTNLTAST